MKLKTLFKAKVYKIFLKEKLVDHFANINTPLFLIVGAQKSGTSSLFYYLNQHPKLFGATKKEVGYFSKEKMYSEGLKYYYDFFKDKNNPFKRRMGFEATPEYLYYPFVPERIFNCNEKMKIIIILRDPVKRAYSAWNMYKDFKEKKSNKYKKILSENSDLAQEFYSSENFPSFEESIDNELRRISDNSKILEPSIIRRGIYLPQIKRYHELFGKDQVMIIGFKELKEDKVKLLNEILTFIGLQPSSWDFLDDEHQNVRSYTEKLDESAERKLREFYKPYNDSLFQYLGKELSW